jgi:hypothetical protein
VTAAVRGGDGGQGRCWRHEATVGASLPRRAAD